MVLPDHQAGQNSGSITLATGLLGLGAFQSSKSARKPTMGNRPARKVTSECEWGRSGHRADRLLDEGRRGPGEEAQGPGDPSHPAHRQLLGERIIVNGELAEQSRTQSRAKMPRNNDEAGRNAASMLSAVKSEPGQEGRHPRPVDRESPAHISHLTRNPIARQPISKRGQVIRDGEELDLALAIAVLLAEHPGHQARKNCQHQLIADHHDRQGQEPAGRSSSVVPKGPRRGDHRASRPPGIHPPGWTPARSV